MKITKRQLRKIVEQTLRDHQPDRAARLDGAEYLAQVGDRVQLRGSGKFGVVVKTSTTVYGTPGKVTIRLDAGPMVTREPWDLIPRG